MQLTKDVTLDRKVWRSRTRVEGQQCCLVFFFYIIIIALLLSYSCLLALLVFSVSSVIISFYCCYYSNLHYFQHDFFKYVCFTSLIFNMIYLSQGSIVNHLSTFTRLGGKLHTTHPPQTPLVEVY